MKEEELRYGNKLLFLNEIVTFEFIDQIREDGVFWIQAKEQKIPHKNFHFKPIPITEDILLKCGFKKELDFFYRKNKSSMIEFSFYDKGIICTNQSVCLSSIEHLHQLQNLYFALTNNELTIDL